ncbi:MAG TPA: 2-C-methyl-D-erythritol 4-phosphate cytidylyltransferase [Ramlibacter sp.]|jgi:2-C-methyl-D-erythritol 4-phosphate cytidylyltransferase
MTGPEPSEVSVLVPAAGRGERMGLGPKALLPLAGRPLVDWVVDKARQLGSEVLVACASGLPAPPGTIRVEGGATREETVERLARQASRPWSLLWDAARPFASLELAREVLAAAVETGAATPCLTSTVRWFALEGGRVTRAVPGSAFGVSQNPQAYSTLLLQAVTELGRRESWTAQSTVELFLLAGHPVTSVPGEQLNIKLTTPDDLLLAQALQARLLSTG